MINGRRKESIRDEVDEGPHMLRFVIHSISCRSPSSPSSLSRAINLITNVIKPAKPQVSRRQDLPLANITIPPFSINRRCHTGHSRLLWRTQFLLLSYPLLSFFSPPAHFTNITNEITACRHWPMHPHAHFDPSYSFCTHTRLSPQKPYNMA